MRSNWRGLSRNRGISMPSAHSMRLSLQAPIIFSLPIRRREDPGPRASGPSAIVALLTLERATRLACATPITITPGRVTPMSGSRWATMPTPTAMTTSIKPTSSTSIRRCFAAPRYGQPSATTKPMLCLLASESHTSTCFHFR